MFAAVEVKFVALHEGRLEERESLDVVPVYVAEENIVGDDGHLLEELLAQKPEARPPVEDDDRLAGPPTSTQLVFPPIWTVLGPGVGMLPRTPQKVICIRSNLEDERTSSARRKVLLSPR